MLHACGLPEFDDLTVLLWWIIDVYAGMLDLWLIKLKSIYIIMWWQSRKMEI